MSPQFWQDQWEKSGVFRCDLSSVRHPDQDVYVAFDSAPFTNGDLHMGHVRNYILGDVDARYQRLMGRKVSYATNFDVFGLPTLLAARGQNRDPRDVTDHTVRRMSEDMRRLGLSYDWQMVKATHDPRYIAYTQFFFNLLYRAGHITHEKRSCSWCESCGTILAGMQVEDGKCERCDTPVSMRIVPQYILDVSAYSRELSDSLEALEEWSDRMKNIHRGYLGRRDAPGGPTFEVDDWVVSRQISWGTPIPILHCPDCGLTPVRDEDLPLLKNTHECPNCGREALAESDSITCFFDDTWCYLTPFVDLDEPPSTKVFSAWDVLPQLDIFHSGYDTFVYPYLYRYFSRVIAPLLGLEVQEPIRRLPGHDMILRDGKKMGKSRGNSISVRDMLEATHPDAIRLGLISAAAPGKPVHWSPEHIDRGALWLRKLDGLVEDLKKATVSTDARPPDRKSIRDHRYALRRARILLGDYRPHAALAELWRVLKDDGEYVTIHPDKHAMIREWIIAISSIAPHIAEDLWDAAGGTEPVAAQRWPGQYSFGYSNSEASSPGITRNAVP